MDADSHAVALAARPSTRAPDVVDALVAAWQKLGRPRYLQVDNELSFRGSKRHPHSFGLLIRLGLYRGVEVVFIPEREPWRNGIVERFNDVDDKWFWRPQPCRDWAHLRRELPHFETCHNTQHRYAQLGQPTPWTVHTATPRRRLAQRFALPRRGLPWREGRLSGIRLTDDRGRVRCFSETFLVSSTLVHEYVRGTMFTQTGQLKFTHQGRVVHVCPYKVNKPRREGSRCGATFDSRKTVSAVVLHDNYCLILQPRFRLVVGQTAPIMAAFGASLVAATPPRPSQHRVGR
jgi:putative transposase